MAKDKRKSKDLFAKLIGMLVGVALVLGISYGLYQITLKGKKKNYIVTGNLSLKIIEDGNETPKYYTTIELIDAVPQSDEEGLEQTPYKFKVVNDGDIDAKYTLELEVGEEETLPDSTVKYALKKENNDFTTPNLLSNTSKRTGKKLIGNNNVTLYKLDEDVIDVGESVDYVLNMWVDIDATNEAMGKELKAIIRIDGVQKNK